MVLEEVSTQTLRRSLDRAEGKQATERLLAAIIYKEGPSVPTISTWFDRHPDTIYRWFDRLERLPVDQAVANEPRPGRPSKLDPDERARLDAALEASPKKFGYDTSTWSTDLVQRHLSAEFGVDYSRRQIRRFMGD